MNGNDKRINPIDIIFIMIFLLFYLLPSISSKYDFSYFLALGVLYLGVCIINDGMTISRQRAKYVILIVFIALLYMLLTDASSIASDVSNRGLKRFISKFYQMFMTFMPLLFLNRMSERASIKQKKIVLVFSYILFGYVMLVTLRELVINPNITRTWAEFEESSSGNIANYYFVYAVPIIIGVCTFAACKTKKIAVRVSMIVAVIVQFYFLLLAQYTLSVLIAVAGVAYEIYVSTENSRRKILLILLFVVLIIALPQILMLAANHVPSEQMSMRLEEIYFFLIGGDTTGYNLNGRLTLYKDTITAFLKSPIWGNRKLGFDGHATFLTVLADLGLLGGIPFYYLYFSSKNRVLDYIGQENKGYIPLFFMFVLMGFTNPIHASLPLAFAVWFIAPLSIELCTESERA